MQQLLTLHYSQILHYFEKKCESKTTRIQSVVKASKLPVQNSKSPFYQIQIIRHASSTNSGSTNTVVFLSVCIWLMLIDFNGTCKNTFYNHILSLKIKFSNDVPKERKYDE